MKSGCLIAGAIALVVVVLFGGCGVSTYNAIVGHDEQVEGRWSELRSSYQRRSDLIPQLVETVKGAAEFEQSTLTEITEARASVGKVSLPQQLPEDPAQLDALLRAQDELTGALRRLLVVAENYPSLKATEAFRDLQVQIEGTENRINAARIDFINAVQAYNVAIRRFPGSIVASVTGFETRPQLEIPESALERPEIDFDFGREEAK